MSRKGIKIRIKNLTKNQFEEIGVFIEMSRMIGREYITIGGDEHYVEINPRFKVVLPIQAVEVIGRAEISINDKRFSNQPTEESRSKLLHKKNKFKKKN